MKPNASFLRSLPKAKADAWIASLTTQELAAIRYDWSFWGRDEQQLPPGDWLTWLILAGRGFGKTRTGSETVRAVVEQGRASRIAMVAETAADARDVLVEGDSGILAVSPPHFRPVYEPSKRRLTWPNGAIATLYNGTEPDQLRGPQHDFALVDELAKFRYAQETWDQLMFGLRLGTSPRAVITTTPRPIPVLKAILKDTGTVVTKGRTADNAANLAKSFMKAITDRYAGTRLGRQELEAEMLEDVPGALWQRDVIEANRRREHPPLRRIVVAIDPPATSGEDADECGLVVAGIDAAGAIYVLEDASAGQLQPLQWARRAVGLYSRHAADRIVAEINNGGEMVETVIRQVDPSASVRTVHATRGKYVRAEPVAALYEQGRVHHVGAFPELEDQMCTYTLDGLPDGSSPDRLDALVWALTELTEPGTAAMFIKKAHR